MIFFLISAEFIDCLETPVARGMLHIVGPLKLRLIYVNCLNLNIYGSSNTICKPDELHLYFIYVELTLQQHQAKIRLITNGNVTILCNWNFCRISAILFCLLCSLSQLRGSDSQRGSCSVFDIHCCLDVLGLLVATIQPKPHTLHSPPGDY